MVQRNQKAIYNIVSGSLKAGTDSCCDQSQANQLQLIFKQRVWLRLLWMWSWQQLQRTWRWWQYTQWQWQCWKCTCFSQYASLLKQEPNCQNPFESDKTVASCFSFWKGVADVWGFFKYPCERGAANVRGFLNTPLREGWPMFADFFEWPFRREAANVCRFFWMAL